MIWNYLTVYLVLGVISSIGSVAFLRPINEGVKLYKIILWAFSTIAVWPFWAVFHITQAIHQKRHIFRCPWCNAEVDFKDPEEVQKHVSTCQKHPMLNEIHRLNKIIANYRKVYFWERELLSNAEIEGRSKNDQNP